MCLLALYRYERNSSSSGPHDSKMGEDQKSGNLSNLIEYIAYIISNSLSLIKAVIKNDSCYYRRRVNEEKNPMLRRLPYHDVPMARSMT